MQDLFSRLLAYHRITSQRALKILRLRVRTISARNSYEVQELKEVGHVKSRAADRSKGSEREITSRSTRQLLFTRACVKRVVTRPSDSQTRLADRKIFSDQSRKEAMYAYYRRNLWRSSHKRSVRKRPRLSAKDTRGQDMCRISDTSLHPPGVGELRHIRRRNYHSPNRVEPGITRCVAPA